MATVALAKYHGLGNDFLVLFDAERSLPFTAELAVALCERHRGVGADGLLRISSGRHGASFAMELRNADGGVAETSGNGLRCAVLAAVHAGLVPAGEVLVETFAGTARAAIGAGAGGVVPVEAEVRVEMGVARVGDEVASPLDGVRARLVDVGNPHLVLVGDSLADVDLATSGPVLEASRPGGVNVEFVVAGPARDSLELVVWERGAGLTEACGSGSCAAAAVARAVGIVGDRVVVRNPGGTLVVELTGAEVLQPSVALRGPARRVARVLVELDDLLESAEVGA
ncbi:MAG TPA: diaminopimelate epimerase [Acidimicrobiales bacterium]|nr:diaminopimelate epimerase [Acidimicrobiales bacterium]